MEFSRRSILLALPGLKLIANTKTQHNPDDYILSSPSGDWNIRWNGWIPCPDSTILEGKWLAYPSPYDYVSMDG